MVNIVLTIHIMILPAELVVANNRFLSVFPKDARDEEPVISGERELKNVLA